MKSLSIKDKAAYFAKVRAKNYASSLRLEGIVVPAVRPKKAASGSDTAAHGKQRPHARPLN